MKKVIITESQFKTIIGEALMSNMIRRFVKRHMPKVQNSLGQTGNTQNIDWSAAIQDYLKNNAFGQGKSSTGQTQAATAISDNALSQICRWETSRDFGYKMSPKDLNGYYGHDNKSGKKTYGYGLLYHPNGKSFMEDIKPVWTQRELEQLFKQKVSNEVQYVLKWANSHGIKLGQGQLDAMVSAVYNFGRQGFINKGIPNMIAQNPNDPRIPEVWAHLSDKQVKRPGLKKRRETEAGWYQSDIQNS